MKLNDLFNETVLLEFRGAQKWNSVNQITKLQKMGQFYPFSLEFDPENKSGNLMYSLDNKGPIKDNLLTKLKKLNKTFILITSLINKLGIRSQNQRVVLVDFYDNSNIVKSEMNINDVSIDGWADHRTGTIYIHKGLFFDDIERFIEVVIHEFAHMLWKIQFTKEEKKKFIRWYNENIASKTFESFYSNSNDYDIWGELNNDKSPLRKKINVVLPELIVNHPRSNETNISQLKKKIENRVRKDRDFLSSENKIREFISTLDFNTNKPKTIPNELSTGEFKELRKFAEDSGMTPSEYAATNPDELWAETVMYAAHNLNSISRELKTLLINMLS